MLRETVLKQLERTAAHLPHNQILSAVLIEIQRHHTAAVPVGIRAGWKAHLHKILAAHIEVRAIALVTAEIVAGGNVEGIAGPEFIKALVQLRGRGHLTTAIERL